MRSREKLDRYLLRGLFADTDVEANPGSGGAKFAVDNDGTDNWPYAKLAWGASGTQTHVASGAGALPIQDGGNSITVDGTVNAAQSGTWNITNVSGTVSLPTGASTAAKQPALGTAGTASADVISVQGIASMTPILATLSGTNNIATVTTVSTVTSLSQFSGNAIDTNSGNKSAGTLRVVLATDQPQLTNKLLVTPDANSAVNVAQINGVTVLMGAGNTGTGSQRVTIASDQAAVAVKAQSTRSYKTASGTLTSDTDVIAAVSSKRIKVYAFSVVTVGTNANAAIWKSNGTGGTELWRFLLQGASGSPMGSNLAVSPGMDGAFLFATVAGEKLTLDVGNGDTLHYSVSYWDDDAS